MLALIQKTTRYAGGKHLLYKNHLSLYNKVVQAILQKRKVIYGEERICISTYEMGLRYNRDTEEKA